MIYPPISMLVTGQADAKGVSSGTKLFFMESIEKLFLLIVRKDG
jgi:hypothetical protein